MSQYKNLRALARTKISIASTCWYSLGCQNRTDHNGQKSAEKDMRVSKGDDGDGVLCRVSWFFLKPNSLHAVESGTSAKGNSEN